MLDEALAAHGAGLCVLPPKQDGSKAPLLPWTEYQARRSTPDEIRRWYADGRRTGLGLVMGPNNGNAELLEFDDVATYGTFKALAESAGLGEVVDRIEAGYLEHSPNGIHWIYRCEEVSGNTKLARRPDGGNEVKVLIETRGKGGFVIVAPSHGDVHPSGRSYDRKRGGWESIATITPAERQAVFDLARTLDSMPRRELRAVTALAQGPTIGEERPGDWYNRVAMWGEVLVPHGWAFCFEHRDEGYWRRPGKDRGISATTNYAGSDLLKVFSSSTVFDTETAYTKFAAFAMLNHDGDYGTAASELARRMPDRARMKAKVPDLMEPPAGYGEDDPEWYDDLEHLFHGEHPPPPADPETEPQPKPHLEFLTAAQLASEVDNAPSVGWLARPVWPADAYGMLAAEMKAGKTWAGLDLVVSVASGTPWLGVYQVDTPGRVLVFLGEGGKRKMLRRLRAICAARGLQFEDLPITLCHRVPHLTALLHVAEVADQMEAHPPVLVMIDPLYLAARGAKSSDLVEMGGHLEVVQVLCQRANSALVIVHHWNKTGEGTGAKRMTGAGPAEWGRVLVSVAVRSRHTDPDGRTNVILDWEFMGDEIPETELRIRRKVWADDQDDLSSPMHYETEVVERDDTPAVAVPEGMAPATRRVLAVLQGTTEWRTVREIGDVVAAEGRPLKPRTIQAALKELVEAGSVVPYGTSGNVWSWRAASVVDEEF